MKWTLWCLCHHAINDVKTSLLWDTLVSRHTYVYTWTVTSACCCCYPKGYAAPSDVPCQCNMRRSPSKLKRTLPQPKIYVTSKSPVGDISVVTLIRTDTTLDHSQEAEKVWPPWRPYTATDLLTCIELLLHCPPHTCPWRTLSQSITLWLCQSMTLFFCQSMTLLERFSCYCWAEAPIKIARMTLTIKLDGNWSSFQLANSTPPQSVIDNAIAPPARIADFIR